MPRNGSVPTPEQIARKKASDIEYTRRWRVANPKRAAKISNDTSRAWRERNPGKDYLRSQAYKQKNPDKVRAQKQRWRAKNPDKVRAYQRKGAEVREEKVSAVLDMNKLLRELVEQQAATIERLTNAQQ